MVQVAIIQDLIRRWRIYRPPTEDPHELLHRANLWAKVFIGTNVVLIAGMFALWVRVQDLTTSNNALVDIVKTKTEVIAELNLRANEYVTNIDASWKLSQRLERQLEVQTMNNHALTLEMSRVENELDALWEANRNGICRREDLY